MLTHTHTHTAQLVAVACAINIPLKATVSLQHGDMGWSSVYPPSPLSDNFSFKKRETTLRKTDTCIHMQIQEKAK